MSAFVEFPIVCHNDGTYELKQMGVNPNTNDYDVRIGSINVDHILGFYPTCNDTQTVVEIHGQTFQIALSYREFKAQLLLNLK